MHAGGDRRRAVGDDVRDRPPVRDRRRRRALEGRRGRRRSPPRWRGSTPRRSRSPSSPARRAATKVPAALVKAVEAAGGVVAPRRRRSSRASCRAGSPQRATELGVELDNQAARALVAQVGERQQRLLRELEKLALEHGQGAQIGVEEVHESCAGSAERKVWTLADALVAGDRKAVDARAARAAPAGRAAAGAALRHGPPPARRAGDRRGARGGPGAGADQEGPADARLRRRPADRRRRQARRRGLPAGAAR